MGETEFRPSRRGGPFTDRGVRPRPAAGEGNAPEVTMRGQDDAVDMADLSFSYPDSGRAVPVLNGISLTIRRGEFVCLIGHSGCGKSTLLNILAGLLPVPAGQVSLSGVPLTGPGTDRAVVFQHYSLFPWMTAVQNVMFGIRQARKKVDKAALRDLAADFLRRVSMGGDMDKYPCQLSGGMQQRVALARALAMDADLLLLDEPFGALDAKRRVELQQLLEELWLRAETPKTVLFVTHDMEEALVLADRILFMRDGRIGADLSIAYGRPRNRAAIVESESYAGLKRRLMNLF